jgi:ADP-ribose pyrophosphatase YjhB (NUDIX family)
MSSPKMARLVPQADGTQPEEVTHISSFALVRKGGEFLLLRRVRPERWAGKWVVPASVLLYGEDPAAGARRALKDQASVEPTELKLLDVQSHGDKHWDICFLYNARVAGSAKPGQDFDKTQYFDLASLPPELRDDHKEVIDLARSRRII